MGTRLWIFGLPEERSTALELLRISGFEAVTVGADKRAIDEIIGEGLRAHVVVGAFSLSGGLQHERDLLVRRLDGSRTVWFGSGCPNNPKVVASSLDRVREAASIQGVEAVVLDGIRFASPGERLKTFMTCFCDCCKTKAQQLGYDISAMEGSLRDVLRSVNSSTQSKLRSLFDPQSPIDLFDVLVRFPGLLEWIRFRAECISEHIAEMKRIVRSTNPRCKLGAYVFPPSLAHLVGQNYTHLTDLLDYVEPMIYRTGRGIACINYEIATVAAELLVRGKIIDQVEIQDFLFKTLGLNAQPESCIRKLKRGISANIVESEARKALRKIGRRKLTPILFLDDPLIKESVEGALRSGVEGLSFFRFHEGNEDTLKMVVQIVRHFT